MADHGRDVVVACTPTLHDRSPVGQIREGRGVVAAASVTSK